MSRNTRAFLLVAVAGLAARSGGAAPPQSACAEHRGKATGESHHPGVAERGDRVMGFDHDRTTHRIVLTPRGGAIEIRANSAEDTESIGAIRAHLPHIARMFAAGDFEAPMLIHGRIPPGVPAMKRLRKSIDWKYDTLEAGGRIRIRTTNLEALAAVHDFLKFQIEDHETGDSQDVSDGDGAGTHERVAE